MQTSSSLASSINLKEKPTGEQPWLACYVVQNEIDELLQLILAKEVMHAFDCQKLPGLIGHQAILGKNVIIGANCCIQIDNHSQYGAPPRLDTPSTRPSKISLG
jgi:hypothetical protein